MKKILVSALLCATFSAPVYAEPLHHNLVEFNESASVRVPNDTMTIILRVSETGKSRQEVSNTVTRRINTILARAKNNKAFDIETANRYAYPAYDNSQKIKGWIDNADLRIQSQDFAALSNLAAESQNEAMIEHISFHVSPKQHATAVEQASEKALKAVQQRAKFISQSLGFSNYKIVNLQFNQSFDNQSSDTSAPMMTMRAAGSKAAYNAEPMDTSPGIQEIQQRIHATIQMQ